MPLHSYASALALAAVAKMKDDDTLNKLIVTGVEAKEENKTNPFKVWVEFTNIFSPEEMNAWPEPGTSHIPGKPGYVPNNPDSYETKATDGSKITGTFSGDLADNHPLGRKWLETYTLLMEAKKEPSKLVGSEFHGLPPIDVARAREKFKARVNSLRNMFRTAIRVHHQYTAIKGMPGVDCYVEQDKDGNIRTDILEPFVVADVSAPDRRAYLVPLGVAGLLRLNVQKAMDKGGGWQNLIDSAKREPAPPETGDSNNIVIDNNEKFDSAVSAMVHYLEKIKGDPRSTAGLLKHLRAAGNGPLVEAAYDLQELLTIITEVPDMKVIYEAQATGTTAPSKAA